MQLRRDLFNLRFTWCYNDEFYGQLHYIGKWKLQPKSCITFPPIIYPHIRQSNLKIINHFVSNNTSAHPHQDRERCLEGGKSNLSGIRYTTIDVMISWWIDPNVEFCARNLCKKDYYQSSHLLHVESNHRCYTWYMSALSYFMFFTVYWLDQKNK